MALSKKPFFARRDGWIVIGVVFAVLAFMFSSSGSKKLPKDIRQQADAVRASIDASIGSIKKLSDQYSSLEVSPDFSEVSRFAARENWKQKFGQATAELDRAKNLYEKDLKPLVKRNRTQDTLEVNQQMKRIRDVIDGAKETARFPSRRYSEIKTVIAKIEQIVKTAQAETRQISQIHSQAAETSLAKALNDFPDLADKTNARFSPLKKLAGDSRSALDVVVQEYGKHRQGHPADYAAVTDSAAVISTGLVKAKQTETQFKDEVEQLYTSYTKILKDMKQDLVLVIKRESWDETSDYYNPAYTLFERSVSAETYEALTRENLDSIASISTGFSGSRLSNHVGNTWNELDLNPTERWPNRSHNAASFWVEDTKETYYHQYILEENGETRETGWEKVDESFYESSLPLLGMALLAKPYGMYEKDRLTQAAPPGMAYVGNDRYGEWKEDDNGERFWSWYGRYAFFSMLFFPPTHYYYNSWAGWHRNYRYSKPYFGTTRNGFQKYGTGGTFVKQSPGFQSTSFAKSGGFRSQAASVRGAGQGLRGGGPGSKGK